MEGQPVQSVSERKFSWWRLIRRFFLWTFISILVLLTAAFALLKIYEKEIKEYAVGILNSYLTSPVYVTPENIDVSFFSSFPYASVDFRDMSALDAWEKKKKDTLFTAHRISLMFNILDVLGDNYSFRKLELEGLDLHLRVDKQGQNNYSIFRESKDTASGSFSLNLEQILVTGSGIHYRDDQTGTVFAAEIKESTLSGNFSDEQYALSAETELFVKSYSTDSTAWLREKKVTTSIDLDAAGSKYNIREGRIQIGDVGLRLEGSYSTLEGSDIMSLQLSGDELSITSVLSLLPPGWVEKTASFESEGILEFRASIEGAGSEPLITGSFGINNGTLKENESGVTFDDLIIKGSFQNKNLLDNGRTVSKPEHFTITQFSGTLEGGALTGKMKVINFERPLMEVEMNGVIGLSDLNGFLKIDTISSIDGEISINASYKGPFRSNGNYKLSDLDVVSTSGQVDIKNANIRLKNSSLEFTNLNAGFDLANADVEIKSFSGNVLESDFQMQGYFRNVVRYFFTDDQDMMIEAGFASSLVNLNELLSNTNTTTSPDTAYKLAFPDRVDLKLDTKVEKVVFRNFEATKIRGGFNMKDQKLIMDPVTFRTMDGSVSALLMVDADRENDILITCDAELKSININKLFYQMENFGQGYLMDKHLRGVANASLQLASVWGKDLTVDPDKVYARSSIEVSKGELIGFEPFIEIADDMKKDIILREMVEVDEFRKKMEHVRFTTLQNEVEIRKQVISIPKMDVKSSAMNITFYGTHTFKHEIDYHFSFLLSEVLTKGKKKRIEKNKEFGEEEDDGTGKIVYYHMTGTTDNFEFKKDYKAKKEKRKEDIKKEKENLKDILRKEFKWFKKDTSGTKKQEEPKSGDKFILNWDEGEKKEEQQEVEDF